MSRGMRALKPWLIPRRFQIWCLTTPKIPLCYFVRSLTAFVPFPFPAGGLIFLKVPGSKPWPALKCLCPHYACGGSGLSLDLARRSIGAGAFSRLVLLTTAPYTRAAAGADRDVNLLNFQSAAPRDLLELHIGLLYGFLISFVP